MARGPFTTADYLSVASAGVTAAPITMVAWAYPTRGGSFTQSVVLEVHDSGSSLRTNCYQIGFYYNNSKAQGQFTRGDAGGGIDAVAKYSPFNQWIHLVGVSSSTTHGVCYVNGIPGAENTTSKTPTSINKTSIGVDNGSAAYSAFAGLVAHAAIWNAVLNDNEIRLLAQGESPQTIRPGNLKAYWPLAANSPAFSLPGNTYGMAQTGTVANALDPPVRRYWMASSRSSPLSPSRAILFTGKQQPHATPRKSRLLATAPTGEYTRTVAPFIISKRKGLGSQTVPQPILRSRGWAIDGRSGLLIHGDKTPGGVKQPTTITLARHSSLAGEVYRSSDSGSYTYATWPTSSFNLNDYTLFFYVQTTSTNHNDTPGFTYAGYNAFWFIPRNTANGNSFQRQWSYADLGSSRVCEAGLHAAVFTRIGTDYCFYIDHLAPYSGTIESTQVADLNSFTFANSGAHWEGTSLLLVGIEQRGWSAAEARDFIGDPFKHVFGPKDIGRRYVGV